MLTLSFSKQRHSTLWRRKSKPEVRQPSVHSEPDTGDEQKEEEEEMESPEEEESSEEEETDVRIYDFFQHLQIT